MQNRSVFKALGLVLTLSALTACGGDAEEPAPAANEPAAPAPATSAAPTAVPEGATAEQVAEGQQIFTGPGLCFTCHGSQGEGTPLAPTLSDDEWIWIQNPDQNLHQQLVDRINTGVPEPVEHPSPMPPKGGANLTPEQVEAVAWYVESL